MEKVCESLDLIMGKISFSHNSLMLIRFCTPVKRNVRPFLATELLYPINTSGISCVKIPDQYISQHFSSVQFLATLVFFAF